MFVTADHEQIGVDCHRPTVCLPRTRPVMFGNRAGTGPGGFVEYSIVDFDARADDPEAITRWVARWLESAEMTELLRAFGYKLSDGSVRERLFEAESITRDIFDFRQGGERWEACRPVFDDAISQITNDLMALLYREPTKSPPMEFGRVDHALVLGGRVNSCLLRSKLLRRLLDEGLDAGHVWGLASRRRVTLSETEVADAFGAHDVQDELDAMTVALQHALGLPAAMGPARESEHEVRTLANQPFSVTGLAAPRGEGKARATTGDTYRFFLDTAPRIGPGDHILVVTSAIAAPFQHALAIAELGIPTGATITSVGAHIATSREPLVQQEWTTAEWLQEVRSTVWSMQQLYLALEDAHPETQPPVVTAISPRSMDITSIPSSSCAPV